MRKTKEDTQITKDQILRGSFECFANRGYDWTTIERVAKQVGVSRGTIYWHFSDKKPCTGHGGLRDRPPPIWGSMPAPAQTMPLENVPGGHLPPVTGTRSSGF